MRGRVRGSSIIGANLKSANRLLQGRDESIQTRADQWMSIMKQFGAGRDGEHPKPRSNLSGKFCHTRDNLVSRANVHKLL